MVAEGVKWESTASLTMFMIGSGAVGLSSSTSIFLDKMFFLRRGCLLIIREVKFKCELVHRCTVGWSMVEDHGSSGGQKDLLTCYLPRQGGDERLGQHLQQGAKKEAFKCPIKLWNYFKIVIIKHHDYIFFFFTESAHWADAV